MDSALELILFCSGRSFGAHAVHAVTCTCYGDRVRGSGHRERWRSPPSWALDNETPWRGIVRLGRSCRPRKYGLPVFQLELGPGEAYSLHSPVLRPESCPSSDRAVLRVSELLATRQDLATAPDRGRSFEWRVYSVVAGIVAIVACLLAACGLWVAVRLLSRLGIRRTAVLCTAIGGPVIGARVFARMAAHDRRRGVAWNSSK